MKSGATAISSDMLFGREAEEKQKKEDPRWNSASLGALGEKLQDHLYARSSVGSKSSSIISMLSNPFYQSPLGNNSMEDYKVAAQETAGRLATGAYAKASQAKHAALDWITSMTADPNAATK